MGPKPYLKDFVRSEVLRSERSTVINQEKVDEVNDFLQTHPGSSVRCVVEASSIPQTTKYRIITDGSHMKRNLFNNYMMNVCQMLLPLLTKLREQKQHFG